MWYAILVALLIIAVFKWQLYKIQFHAYVAFMVKSEARQPTESEMQEQIQWAVKNMIHDSLHK